jgi:hypothetical protein
MTVYQKLVLRALYTLLISTSVFADSKGATITSRKCDEMAKDINEALKVK